MPSEHIMTEGEQERGFQKITMPKPPAQMSNCYDSCLLNMRNDFQPHQNLNSSNIMRPTLTDCGGGGLIHCNTQKSHLVTFTQTSYGHGEDRSEQQRQLEKHQRPPKMIDMGCGPAYRCECRDCWSCCECYVVWSVSVYTWKAGSLHYVRLNYALRKTGNTAKEPKGSQR